MTRIHVFFIDEYSSSKQNGIGTFRDTLLPRLSCVKDISITLISLNSGCDDLRVDKHAFGYEYALPIVAHGNWREHGDVIWPLLRTYIPDCRHNIFIFNHSPAANFIRSMKCQYPASQSIFVIHDQGWCKPLFGSAKLLEKVVKHECVVGISEDERERVRQYCNREHEIYGEVNKVVCLSYSTEKVLRHIYNLPAGSFVRIENGYDTACNRGYSKWCARKKLCIRQDEDVLLFVGRPMPHKGILALLQALRILRRKRPNIKCVLAGAIHGFANHWELGREVATSLILPGYQSAEEMRLWYAAADVGVLSSYTEQCSYAALEMMHYGVTIVSSSGNGLRDMFTDKKDSVVVPIGNVLNRNLYAKRLARAIITALNLTKTERRKLTKNSKELLKSRYSAELMAKRYVELFRNLVSK